MNSIDFINYKGTQYSIGGVNGKTHLKILILGNSYATDAWSYVPFILKNYGITCEIVIYFRGALSLDELYNRWDETKQWDEESTTESYGARRYLYTIDTRTQTSWQGVNPTLERKSAHQLCLEDGWDIITLLQWSAYTVDYTTFEPITDVIDLIREAKAEAGNEESWHLGFQMSWTRAVADYPTNNLASHLSNDKAQPIDILFPCSTAVFNARQNANLAAIGSYDGHLDGPGPAHNLWQDGVHLEEGLPCYIAALAIVQSLFDKYWRGLTVLGDKTIPTRENVTTNWKVPQRQIPSGNNELPHVLDADYLYLCQKAAILANKYKFEINGV